MNTVRTTNRPWVWCLAATALGSAPQFTAGEIQPTGEFDGTSVAGSVLPRPFSSPACEPRGVHIGITDDPTTMLAVSWYTRCVLGGEPIVAWEARDGSAESGKATGISKCAPRHPSIGPAPFHHVTIKGLKAHTEYALTLPHRDEALRVWTAPAESDSISFIAFGDVGTRRSAKRFLRRVSESVRAGTPPGFALVLGDWSYANKNLFPDYGVKRPVDQHGLEQPWHETWCDLFDGLSGIAEGMPVFGPLGNHDHREKWRSPRKIPWSHEALTDRVVFPEGGGPDGRYYTVRWGSLQIFVFDVESLEDRGRDLRAQYEWAEGQLKESHRDAAITWRIALVHTPVFPSPGEAQNPQLVRALSCLFEQKSTHVDLVLSGDLHIYERSVPILRQGEGPSKGIGGESPVDRHRPCVGEQAVRHITVGTGGRSGKSHRRFSGGQFHAFPARDDEPNRNGFLRVDIVGDQLTTAFYRCTAPELKCSSFDLIDRVTIRKTVGSELEGKSSRGILEGPPVDEVPPTR